MAHLPSAAAAQVHDAATARRCARGYPVARPTAATLAAFRRAIDDGAEGIEFDVRLAKDGVAVVFHDATLNRTGLRDGNIADLTSAELAKIDIGSWFNKMDRRNANVDFSLQKVSTLPKTL